MLILAPKILVLAPNSPQNSPQSPQFSPQNLKRALRGLALFGVIATIFSVYRNENVIAELKPILNWFKSLYGEYTDFAEVSLLSTNAINNIALKILAIIGVIKWFAE
jgi:hypothetical protein